MRIALLNQFFWPDAIATSQFLSDLACPLACEHEVTAICGDAGVKVADSGPSPGAEGAIIRTRNLSLGHGGSACLASYVSYQSGAIHWYRAGHSKVSAKVSAAIDVCLLRDATKQYNRTRI
jgi:hypothetical protein